MKKLILFALSIMAATLLHAQPISKVYTKITVAQDGSGDFKTIQEAINNVRDLGQFRVPIFIKKGVYHEKLVIPSWKTKISLIGEDKENTIITNDDYSGKAATNGKDQFGRDKMSTYTSFTVQVQSDDIILENLTIENKAGRVGQAVALHIEGDRCIVRNCRLLGNQDTLYTATAHSRELFQDCYIEGTTDFIFGEATCVFQRCTIKALTNSFITAAATTPLQEFGYVLMDCKLIADPSVTKEYLGRPWRSYANVVYLRTEMGSFIIPEGWNPWKGDAMFPDKEKTAYYAEYKCTGPGADAKARVAWSHQLTDKEAKKYTIKNILSGWDKWDPEAVKSN
ncbi:pectinesterase [Mucilaginibacter yixingensis]|uniref:Pectinesterase n=1 Tax=Mucilaginibacter yixingensis TaxID=1295612 RepID=A0A2T5JAB3_9SPHI|nr:pectinesterase family protein [Mucilaginibacter yixingensis]PTQ96998.1 pectinesterase [Mucilaginibacter yixingensis]